MAQMMLAWFLLRHLQPLWLLLLDRLRKFLAYKLLLRLLALGLTSHCVMLLM
jgi:hypothetical protein